MRKEPFIIGRYRGFWWEAQSPEGVSGWCVQVNPGPGDGFGEIISKHHTRPFAVAAARRYDAADKRRAS